MKRIREIYSYRDMIKGLVSRDLRGRYKGSVLGFLWNFINPLCQILVFYIVFSRIFNNGIDKFHVFLVVGMMPWNFFSESLCQGAGSIMSQAEMTKKIYFPREVLPIATVTSRFVNLLLTFVVIFVIIICSNVHLSFGKLIYLPLVLFVEYILSLAFAILLSSIDIYFRDVEYMVGVAMMALVWMTPIMYSYESVTGILHTVLSLNPMTSIVVALQNILYYDRIPDFNGILYTLVFAVVLLIIGEITFRKLEKGFAEEL